MTVDGLHALLGASVDAYNGDRQRLVALMSALENPVRAAELPPDDALVAAARRHRLSPILSIVAGTALSPTLADRFRRDRLLTVARNLVLAGVASECIRSLATDGIPTIILKGLAYEQMLYGAAGARPTADIDLLVPNEKRRLAFQVLDRLGFEPRASSPGFDDPDYHEVAWNRRGVEVDLHLALAPFARCPIDYVELWALAQPLRFGTAEAFALHPVHAVLFHALHMGVDHFDVPAIYLLDLSRLLALAPGIAEIDAKARVWRCHRPLATALALTATFLPNYWRNNHSSAPSDIPTPRIIERYGSLSPLPRPEQLLRKLTHFDTVGDAVRYVAVQSRRIAREQLERHILKRSPRERLSLSPHRDFQPPAVAQRRDAS